MFKKKSYFICNNILQYYKLYCFLSNKCSLGEQTTLKNVFFIILHIWLF